MSSIFDLKPASAGPVFKQIDAGKYDAVVHAVIDLGEHETFYQNESTGVKGQVQFLFELPSVLKEDGTTTIKGVKAFNVSNNEKSHLVKTLIAILDLPGVAELNSLLSEAGPKKVMDQVLGKAVTLTVGHWTNAEGTDLAYIDKGSIAALDSRLPQPESQQEPFNFSVSSKEAPEVFKTRLSKRTQGLIMTSVNVNEFSPELQQAFVEVEEDNLEDKVLG